MSKNELVAKIEALNEWEAVIEEAKAEAEAIRDSIKAEMMERDTEEMTAGKYIVRWTSVLSNRFDTTAFKKAHGELYKEYTKQSAKMCIRDRSGAIPAADYKFVIDYNTDVEFVDNRDLKAPGEMVKYN